ncbi:Protein CBG06555 [Caenorhabditis briggsae]|uniref:Protein CBG06555 n=1 Tax=Caenorhabditis briggsae TaxID=6238 RepID=A8X2I5_CAEBR|nr:Protein CBG06555 [Caenorhabditis briggsae]CAP26845.1 Protein CBG06555 [Caenorhabditis briggsae]
MMEIPDMDRILLDVWLPIGTYYSGYIDDYSKNYFELDMIQKFGVGFSGISGFVLVAYHANGTIRLQYICCTINMTFIMLFQYSIILYCAIRMYFEMKSKVQFFSPSLRNLHRQFFKTLVLQVVTPTVTLFAPVTVLIYLPLFDLQLDLPTGLSTSALVFYPALDAIIIIYVVRDYRNAVKNILKRLIDCLQNWANSSDAEEIPTTTIRSPSVLN